MEYKKKDGEKIEKNKIDSVKRLIEKGKKNGMLTYKEIADALEEIDLDVEQIDDIYLRLEDMGIDIVGEKEEDLLLESDDEDGDNEEDINTEDLSVPKGINVLSSTAASCR